MNRIYPNSNWKESWKYSYPYDLLEIYGVINKNIGYAYAYENRKLNTISLIQNVLKKGDTILDVAAAQGNFSLILAEMGYAVTWNDIRTELIDYVKMKYEYGSIHYQPGNVFDVVFSQKFDLVLATEIIEHVAHPDEFLKNLSTLVKLNGHILISTPLGSYFKNRLPKFTFPILVFLNPGNLALILRIIYFYFTWMKFNCLPRKQDYLLSKLNGIQIH